MSTSYSPLGDSVSPKRGLFHAGWPTMLPPIVPRRLKRRIRSRIHSHMSPASSSITKLETSFNPADTLRALRRHHWTVYDAQYLLLAIIGIFALSIIQVPGPFVKTLAATLIILSLLIPITRQFFMPILPIFGWLFLWFAAQFIPGDYRPPIWVRVLPALENILYGANLSNILSAHQNSFLSILAWLPYGITHFGAPFVCSAIMFLFSPPGTVPMFARTFGYMNLIGVGIQLIFPCSAPWYENMYGLAPANYKMPGSPAGLAAIDKLFGVDMYTSSFTASPLVFGAFPSLHAGSATIEALFMSHVFPSLKPLFVVYALWLCWATMYLSHHYAVDLVGGALLSSICFFIVKSNWLPQMQMDCFWRWDYDHVVRGESFDDYAYGAAEGDDDFRHTGHSDDEYWSMGSTSSYDSHGHRSPSATRSPIDGTAPDHNWDTDTVAGFSDPEKR